MRTNVVTDVNNIFLQIMNPMGACMKQGGCFVMSRTVRSQAQAMQSMQGPYREILPYQHYNNENQYVNVPDPYIDDFAF